MEDREAQEGEPQEELASREMINYGEYLFQSRKQISVFDRGNFICVMHCKEIRSKMLPLRKT